MRLVIGDGFGGADTSSELNRRDRSNLISRFKSAWRLLEFPRLEGLAVAARRCDEWLGMTRTIRGIPHVRDKGFIFAYSAGHDGFFHFLFGAGAG